MAQKIEEFDIKKEYGNIALTNKNDFINKYKVNMAGLTASQVAENQKKYGTNQISGAKPKRWYHYFFESLFSPFNAILLGIALVLIYTDIILPAIPNPANIIVIICLVLISTFLEFFEEYRSNKAAEKLKEMVETKGSVIRNGKKEKIPFKDFTVGDIVSLSAGDLVPADLRILEAKDLFVGQSSITGESDSIKKVPDSELKSIDELESITDLDNICFMGTNVVSGSAKCVVVKVADDTYFGKVAHTITSGKPKTEFQKGIENISKLLTKFMLFMIPLTFIVNAWKHDLLVAFTFSVAIAIGITPLLLPVILSSCLSKGAVRMSKKKTIVKKLDSIQNFGAMNILCTDKTGTLTQNKMTVENYYVNGESVCSGEIDLKDPAQRELLMFSMLCNDSTNQNGQEIGDPTETALINLGSLLGESHPGLRRRITRMSAGRLQSVRGEAGRRKQDSSTRAWR